MIIIILLCLKYCRHRRNVATRAQLVRTRCYVYYSAVEKRLKTRVDLAHRNNVIAIRGISIQTFRGSRLPDLTERPTRTELVLADRREKTTRRGLWTEKNSI